MGGQTAIRGGRAEYDTLRRSLFADLRGTVLEIGAGAGANFGLLPTEVRWLGVELSRRRLIRSRAAMPNSSVLDFGVLAGVGEHIPLRDQSVDAVISTIVLCSARDQERVLAKVRRASGPEARSCSASTWLRLRARRRNGFSRPWLRCPAASTTAAIRPAKPGAIERAGFARIDLDWFTIAPRWSPYNPCIVDRAIA
jgi:hypothetical protein